jgi:conjugative transfer region protein (TIGR03750 family)
MKRRHGDSSATQAAPTVTVRATYAPVTDRVNAEPPILNGMTASEGGRIAVLCLIVYSILGAVLATLTGWWLPAAFVVLLGSGGTVWYASLYLAKVKRNRPEGYYAHVIQLWLSDHGIGHTGFLRRDGYWSVGREMPFGGFTSPLVVHKRPTNSSASIFSIWPKLLRRQTT